MILTGSKFLKFLNFEPNFPDFFVKFVMVVQIKISYRFN